jgi:hypothetical protein
MLSWSALSCLTATLLRLTRLGPGAGWRQALAQDSRNRNSIFYMVFQVLHTTQFIILSGAIWGFDNGAHFTHKLFLETETMHYGLHLLLRSLMSVAEFICNYNHMPVPILQDYYKPFPKRWDWCWESF